MIEPRHRFGLRMRSPAPDFSDPELLLGPTKFRQGEQPVDPPGMEFHWLVIRPWTSMTTPWVKDHRLHVWDIARRLNEGQTPEAVAGELGIALEAVTEAKEYYDEFKAEVDSEIEAASRSAREALG